MLAHVDGRADANDAYGCPGSVRPVVTCGARHTGHSGGRQSWTAGASAHTSWLISNVCYNEVRSTALFAALVVLEHTVLRTIALPARMRQFVSTQ